MALSEKGTGSLAVQENLWDPKTFSSDVSDMSSQLPWWRHKIYLLEWLWCSELNGAGELGESVYGEKADESPPVGEGIIMGLLSAIVCACVL